MRTRKSREHYENRQRELRDRGGYARDDKLNQCHRCREAQEVEPTEVEKFESLGDEPPLVGPDVVESIERRHETGPKKGSNSTQRASENGRHHCRHNHCPSSHQGCECEANDDAIYFTTNFLEVLRDRWDNANIFCLRTFRSSNLTAKKSNFLIPYVAKQQRSNPDDVGVRLNRFSVGTLHETWKNACSKTLTTGLTAE